MAKKKEDIVLDEIDAFLEQEKTPKKKKRAAKKEEVIEEVVVEEKPKAKRGRKKKEVIEEVKVEEVIEEPVEEVVEEPKEEKKVKIVKEKKVTEDNEEDLYLTTSFKPIKTKKRLKRGVIKFFRNIIILGLLIVVGYFGYGKLKDIYLMSKPINVYKTVITETSETLNNTINNINLDENYEIKANVDTNIDKYNYLNNNVLGYAYSVKDYSYIDYVTVNDKGMYTIIDNEKMFTKYYNSENIVDVNEEESRLRDVISYFVLNKDNIKDVINDNKDIIIELLDEDSIKTSKEELIINGNSINVNCNTLKLDEDLVEEYLNKVLNDKILVNKMAKVFDMKEDEFEEYLDTKLNKLVDKVNFNLYTYKFEVVGFDIEVDGFREAYVYVYNDEYDINVNELLTYLDIKDDLRNSVHLSSYVQTTTDNAYLLDIKDIKDNKVNFVISDYSEVRKYDVTISNDEVIVKYSNNDKYMNVDVKFNSINEYSIEVNDVLNNAKKINREHINFNNELNDNEKDSFNLLNEIIYG